MADKPCPSCGHCPTCGHSPQRAYPRPSYPYPYYYGPYWYYQQPTTVAPAQFPRFQNISSSHTALTGTTTVN